jgi:3',5'-cyclic AMP phosphodiesterase CpdA
MRTLGRVAAAGFSAALLAALGACRESSVPPDARRTTTTEVRELTPRPGELALPLNQGSVRFAVIGDSGRGDQSQHEIAQQMVAWRAKFPFDFVVMLGDNIYPPNTPQDYVTKFEEPYRALLDAGVTFHAAIGNHDPPGTINYAKFNMEGRRYYTFRQNERRLGGLAGAGVRFFVLDSRGFDPVQLAWLQAELAKSETAWKICYFHHPIYTSGRYTSSARVLRLVLEPLLIKGDVDVVLSGHEHFYERVKPQHGITYFISGGAGSLRRGDITPSPRTARGFDTDYHFMIMEVSGDTLYFQAISRTGATVDAGAIVKGDGQR